MSKNKGYILRVRNSRTFRGMATFLVLNVLFEVIQPTVSLALTEGPSQPEVQSFEPVGTTDMVDMFTGDFNYNIPLFNLPGPNGGYPINLAYHAGASVDEEASWVGLGWNINAGSLVRNMRGLPDEFMSNEDQDGNAEGTSDYLEVKRDMKQNMTVGFAVNGSKAEMFGAKLDFNTSFSVYYNNYRGIGASIDAGIHTNGTYAGGGAISVDSENGLGLTADISYERCHTNQTREHKLGLTFDGNLSVKYSSNIKEELDIYNRRTKQYESNATSGSENFGSSYSFARSVFSPSLGSEMNNWNASFGLYTGIGEAGAYASAGGNLFFRTEDYSNSEKKGRKHLVVGYDRVGDETNSEAYSKDFNREREGRLTAATLFLPSSNYSYDTYHSTGQGLSGFFRPKRNDVGHSHDPRNSNNTYGGSFSGEVGTKHGALDFGVNIGWSGQGTWNDKNDKNFVFQKPRPYATGSSDENLYYSAHGESVILDDNDISYMGSLDLPFVRLAAKGGGQPYLGKRRIENSSGNFKDKKQVNLRNKRNTTIHNLTNAEVANIGEFPKNYYEWSPSLSLMAGPAAAFDRSARNSVDITNHYAGFKVLNGEGSYYVYGLPAYNMKDVSNLFSVGEANQENKWAAIKIKKGENGESDEVDYKTFAKGHQYINKVSKSPYAHSYLLTSVQGADYVDLTNNGPTEDDLGYWVKFSYVKKSSAFKWRAPYDHSTAYRSAGDRYTTEDDKASYNYGEKELWYLGRMETKTHVAVFQMSERKDMIEAAGEISDQTDNSTANRQSPLKLDKILIYSKQALADQPQNPTPLQTVNFEYEYLLCPGVPNHKNTNDNENAKLTLKKVYFTSNGSDRGKLNSYDFDYFPHNPDDIEIPENYDNPRYFDGASDSWGTYKPVLEHEFSSNFPYVNQFNQDWNTSKAWEPDYPSGAADKESEEITRKSQAGLAAAWCLKTIKLPSGGVIRIDYESDDYGYVQHKTANQMFKIVSFGKRLTNMTVDEVYHTEDDDFSEVTSSRRIYFKLEKPIPVNQSPGDVATTVWKNYVQPIHAENGERNLYFKSKMQLTESVSDYVSGYLPLEPALADAEGVYHYGVASAGQFGGSVQSIDGVNCYTVGFVTVKPAVKPRNPSENLSYHPMALAAWTYMQTNANELLMNSNSFSDDLTEGQAAGKIGDFINILPMIAESFGSIRKYCAKKGFARKADLDLSCIRLASPDKIKYGGGHRVKTISIMDMWHNKNIEGTRNRVYGQSYEYQIEENGKLISSGVAQYEPQAGGDENALKYPYHYQERQTFFTKNNIFAEAPVNESLFPGPSVGYRKVTVKSLNTKDRIGGPAGQTVRTAGVTIHEFYTSKDFPTRVEFSQLKEENSTLDIYNLTIPIPLVGTLKYNYFHGTQAFKIELNDMHGKPRSVKSYEINNYTVNPNAISEVEYEYHCSPVSYMNENVLKLENDVQIVSRTSNTILDNNKRMGVEVDLFTDQRESNNFSLSAALDFNVDVLPLPIPALTIWPSYSNTKVLMRTYVTNKVVDRKGILKRVKSRDLQTVSDSEFIAYDEVSGSPVLTRVKDEFGDYVYSYNIPAYYKYDGMAHAYRNIDFKFKAALSSPSNDCYYKFDRTTVNSQLVRGDEVLVSRNGSTYRKGYFLGWANQGSGAMKGMLHLPWGGPSQSAEEVEIKVIRSGRRNHFGTMVAGYTLKGDLNSSISTLALKRPDGTSYLDGKKFGAAKVLAASATLYNDNWRDEVRGTYQSQTYVPDPTRPNSTVTLESFNGNALINPYLSGASGIWRSHKTYSFVGKRRASRALDHGNSNPNLRFDGVFEEEVPLFDWSLGLPEDYTQQGGNPFRKWEWASEVTRYSSDAYELENVNRLGIFSSALYGYNSSLSIAVSGNASVNEIGVMDFETVNNSTVFGNTIYQNNISVYKSNAGRPPKMLVSEHKNFYKAEVSGNTVSVYMKFKDNAEKADFNAHFTTLTTSNQYGQGELQISSDGLDNIFGISLVSKETVNNGGNSTIYLNAKYVSKDESQNKYVFRTYMCDVNNTYKYLAEGSHHYGKLTMLFKRKVSDWIELQNVSFMKSNSSIKAHSGKSFMKATGAITFDQPKLKVIPGKPYVFSCWVARDNSDVKTYKQDILLQVAAIDVSLNGTVYSHLEIPNARYTYGKIIEGWQKIDVEFTVVPGSPYANKVFAFKFNPGSNPLYVDDVRFSPAVGGMKTYVYDPALYRLSASLNVDNYASFYFYDEQGNLTLTKQETEEGIFTVSQSRGKL